MIATQQPPKIRVGDTVYYGSHPMTVALILDMNQPPHPTQSPGIYFGLHTPEMMTGLYFIIPEWEVNVILPIVA